MDALDLEDRKISNLQIRRRLAASDTVVLGLDGIPARCAADFTRIVASAAARRQKSNIALVVIDREPNAGSCSTQHIEIRAANVLTSPMHGIDFETALGPRARWGLVSSPGRSLRNKECAKS